MHIGLNIFNISGRNHMFIFQIDKQDKISNTLSFTQ